MVENKEVNIEMENLLDELSEGMASCVGQAIMNHIYAKEVRKAENTLIKEGGLSKTDSKKLVQYLINKSSRKKELVEISIQDIDKTDFETSYLISFGEILGAASVNERQPGKFYFIGLKELIELEKAHQVWKINYT
jgi:polyhydroxyalkanoate synthesis regulator phasin